MSRQRNWCYTLNNYTDEDVLNLKAAKCDYHVFGREVAPSTGTHHLQGFIVFAEAKTITAVQKATKCPRISLSAKYKTSTFKQASDYCKKEDEGYYESGVLPMDPKDKGAAAQEHYKQLRAAASEGRFDDIDEKSRFCHIKLIEHHRFLALKARELPDAGSTNYWYWGSSGTGKSRKARTENPGAYLKMCNKWWDGYTDEKVVFIEDFDKVHSVLCHHMKIWADRYPFLGEVKGESFKIRPEQIIVTSNYHPRDIWTDEKDLEPILRRFQCIEFRNLAAVDAL